MTGEAAPSTETSTDRPLQAILFACTFNAVRSPMAEALLRWRSGGRLYVRSCGTRPGGQLDVFAVAVMAELGLDITGHVPTTFEELDEGGFDLVITLAPDAQHRAVELTRSEAVDIEYWPTYDATATHGSREQKIAAYREVRDQLDANIQKRFAEWVTS